MHIIKISINKILIFSFLLNLTLTQAQHLDSTFDVDGKVTTTLGNDDNATASVLQPDGKIITTGFNSNRDLTLIRYNPNGSLDTSFNLDGIVTYHHPTDFTGGYEIVLQPDGKILIAVTTYNSVSLYDFGVMRFNPNGDLDTTFGTTGFVTLDYENTSNFARGIALQSDGKIVISGYSYTNPIYSSHVIRYNTNGTLDTTFNTTGLVTTIYSSNSFSVNIALQPDQKIIVCGWVFGTENFGFLTRYNPNGTLDNSFGISGIAKMETASNDEGLIDFAFTPDSKIIAAGWKDGNIAIIKTDTNGILDSNFGTSGITTTDLEGEYDYTENMTLQPDGKILVTGPTGGSNSNFGLLRYLSDGNLDLSFGNSGKIILDFEGGTDAPGDVLLQSDNKIIITGTATIGGIPTMSAARYDLTLGTPDYYKNSNFLVYPIHQAKFLRLTPQKLLKRLLLLIF